MAGGKQGRDREEDSALEEEGRLVLIQQVMIFFFVFITLKPRVK